MTIILVLDQGNFYSLCLLSHSLNSNLISESNLTPASSELQKKQFGAKLARPDDSLDPGGVD